jgi:protein-S-isoprenylcysteine O-methyltransferase Ste14
LTQLIIIIIQTIFFTGVIWSNLFFFKKSTVPNFYIYTIKIVGTFLIIDNLYLSFTDSDYSVWQSGLSLALLVTANVLFFWSIYINFYNPLHFAFTHLEKNYFKKLGPYKFIRHPIYASYTYSWIAGIVLHKSLVLAGLTAIMVSLYYKASMAEEESLLSGPLKTQYNLYREQTGLYWPKIF